MVESGKNKTWKSFSGFLASLFKRASRPFYRAFNLMMNNWGYVPKSSDQFIFRGLTSKDYSISSQVKFLWNISQLSAKVLFSCLGVKVAFHGSLLLEITLSGEFECRKRRRLG
jgi:hypothetical protein